MRAEDGESGSFTTYPPEVFKLRTIKQDKMMNGYKMYIPSSSLITLSLSVNVWHMFSLTREFSHVRRDN